MTPMWRPPVEDMLIVRLVPSNSGLLQTSFECSTLGSLASVEEGGAGATTSGALPESLSGAKRD